MGNLLQAIGRAQPATQIEQYRTAITNRENETLRTQAYVQSQENNARLQAQQLERIQRQNQIEKQTLIENDKIVPIESITDSLMYPEMRALVKKFGMQKGYLTEDGSSFKKGDEAKFLQDMQKGQFAELMMRTRIDVSKRHYNENQSLIDEAMSKGDVKKAAKLKENSASLKTNLERAQAMSETWKAQKEAEIKEREVAVKEKNANKTTDGSGNDVKYTAYTASMNQILKEYGGSGGMNFETNPDGTMTFSQGGEKAYQDMIEKAGKGDMKARENLQKYNSLKRKLLELVGISSESEAPIQKRLIFKDGQFIEK